MLKNTNEIAQYIFFFINSTHLRNFCCCDSLKQEHLFVRNIRKFVTNFFFTGSCSWVHIAHEKSSRHSAGEVCLVSGKSQDKRNDVVVDVTIGVKVQEFGDRVDSSLPDDSLIMSAKLLQICKDQSMLVAKHGG